MAPGHGTQVIWSPKSFSPFKSTDLCLERKEERGERKQKGREGRSEGERGREKGKKEDPSPPPLCLFLLLRGYQRRRLGWA